jgi:polyhydroxyalkanoate synthesis regulator phasin
VIALGGMMTGKLFVANWLILPEMNKLAADQQAFAREMQKEMDDGSVEKVLNENPEVIAVVALQELVKKGKVAPETFDLMIQDYLNPTGEDSAIDTEEIGTQIQELVESWDKKTALSKTKEHLPELTRIMFLKAKPKIGFGEAITTTFAYWDLFCIPMGLLWAFKLGNGSET